MNRIEKIELLRKIQQGESPEVLLFAENKHFLICEDRYFYNEIEYPKEKAEELIKKYNMQSIKTPNMKALYAMYKLMNGIK